MKPLNQFNLKKLYQNYVKKCKKINWNPIDFFFILEAFTGIKHNILKEKYLTNTLEISAKHYDKLASVLQRSFTEPWQYKLKKCLFNGNWYFINRNVLIPRIETEYLYQYLKNDIKKNHISKKKINIIEFGVGSGCLANEIKNINKKQIHFYGIDYYRKTLRVTKKNAKKIVLIKNNWTKNLKFYKKSFNYIISNPPYIYKWENTNEKLLKHEPDIALYGNKKDVIIYYLELFDFAKKNLDKSGTMILECSNTIKLALANYLKQYKEFKFLYRSDYNKLIRYLIIKFKNENISK